MSENEEMEFSHFLKKRGVRQVKRRVKIQDQRTNWMKEGGE